MCTYCVVHVQLQIKVQGGTMITDRMPVVHEIIIIGVDDPLTNYINLQ